jgi:hypothetical protein
MPLTPITVATYNLYLGADLSPLFGEVEPDRLAAQAAALWSAVEASRPVERMHAAAAVLARRLPEVIAVQEAALWRAGRTGAHRTHDLLDLLLASLHELGAGYRVAVRTDSFTSGQLSTSLREATGQVIELADRSAILVRDDPTIGFAGGPDAASSRKPTWRLFDDALAVTVLGKPLTVVRGWCAVDVRVGTRTVHVVNTHLEAFDAGVRTAQARQLVADALAGHERGAPTVVLGDLNCRAPACRTGGEADGDAYETLLAAGLLDAWAAVHPDDLCGGGTCGQAADLRNQISALDHRIDMVLVAPDTVTVRAAEVLGGHPNDRTPSGLWPSDHACLVVDLEV